MRLFKLSLLLSLGFLLTSVCGGQLRAQGSLPSGWSDGDVGSVGTSGSASYANNVFTVNGAGNGLGSTADGFHFVYQALSGDGTIVARVVSAPSNYEQAALVIRQTLDAGSANVSLFFQSISYPSSTINLTDRTSSGGNTSTSSTMQNISLPYWLKLVRSGSTFTGYVGSDGVNWGQIGSSQTINMGQSVYVGLAASGVFGSATATFDNVSLSTPAAPAPVITGLSATTGPVGTQVVISGSGFGATRGSSVVLLNGASMTVNSWSATSITITIATGATSGPLGVSVAPAMNESNPIDFAVTSQPLPSQWLDGDIGIVGPMGSANYSNGVFTVRGAGGLIGNGGGYVSADGLHFVYLPLTGDGTIVARVLSVSLNYSYTGVMMRETLDARSANAYTAFGNSPQNAVVVFGDRLITGTNNYMQPAGSYLTVPYWVKLVRSGNVFTGFMSTDGTNWQQVAPSQTINLAQTVYMGVFSAGASQNLSTATFDSVSISTPGVPVPTITGLSTTTGPAGTPVVISGSGFGTTQGGSVVLLNDAPMTVTSWSATSISITIATGATSGALVVSVAPSMIDSNPAFFEVTTQPLPSPWLNGDVGPTSQPGSATYSSGTFTLDTNGASFGGLSDAFHFVYRPLATDGTLVARLTGVAGSSTGIQAGIVIRETLDAFSSGLFAFYSKWTTALALSYRTSPGGVTLQANGPSVALPYWFKLVRASNTFSAWSSTDGATWVQLGATQTLTTAQTVYVGLAVTGGSSATQVSATFDNVTLTAGGALANPVVTGVSPASGAPGATVTVTGTGFGTTQGTGSVAFNAAVAVATSWSDSQVVVVAPDGFSTGPVSVTQGNITGVGPTFTAKLTAQVTDSLGNSSTYHSSAFGGLWSYTDASGSGCSSCTTRGTVNNQYDSNGALLWRTDALGNTTSYKYDLYNDVTKQFAQVDANNLATTSYTYNNFGEVLSMTDPLGNVTNNAYDGYGNLTSVTTPAPSGGAQSSVTQFAYDSKGELTQITDPLNNVTTLTYTAAGLIATIKDAQSNVTTYGYDAHGNRTSVTDALNHHTTFTYDAGDRLTKITYPDSTTTTFGYDYRGRRTSVTDQNGKTTSYAYDDADRLTSVTDAANNVTQYAYDTESNLTSIQDANGHTTMFSYDAFGRVTRTSFPSSNVETYGYDANNNLTSKTDRKSQTISYVYDALNRLSRKLYPDSSEVDYVYDLVGKVQSVNDPTGTYAFAYDNMGRLIGTTTTYNFLTSRSFTTSYSYDAASNRTGFTDPESGSTSYAYDTLNRLTTLTPPSAFTTGSFGFSYDALSRRTQMTRPNNITSNYAYDNLSRLLSVLHQSSGSTMDGASYTLDNAGNRTAKTDQHAGVTSNYAYDAIYQLTQAGAATVPPLPPAPTETYSYDAVGNRTASLGVLSYNYNVSNELTAKTGVTYTYDNNGNTLTKVDSIGTTTYVWDFENRLTSVTLPGSGGTVSFKYDPFGRRIEKTTSSTTSIYAYDADNVIEETNASGAVFARYSQGPNIDEPLAMLRAGATSFYHADGLGSVTSLSNVAGALAETYTFDSFGNQTASSGSLTNPFRYTGREFDTESNLYYMRARYFDPATGRFISEDPIRPEDAIDFYVYTSNNPINFTDPLGLYDTHPAVPKPLPPRLDEFMKCMDGCTGKPQFVRATTNGDHVDPGHAAGTTVDLRPVGPSSDKVFCCAGQCGAVFVLDERKLKTKKGQGLHYHIQLELSIIPNAPNSIPDRPECKPKGCDANKK